MVFSSLTFLFLFLPPVLVLYYLLPQAGKNAFLFAASLFFYAWGEPVYIVLMLFSTVADYVLGLIIEKHRHNKQTARLFLVLSLLVNVGILGFFKYFDFLVQSINALWGTNLAILNLPLPLGISFYTFQTMSYTIDVYRNEVPVQRRLIDFCTYVTLFPQLVAGPIVRYQEVEKQLRQRQVDLDTFGLGAKRFIAGLGKKVLLANNIGLLWQQVEQLPPEGLSVVTAWLGIVAYALQIYFDFSGYSDMAIGLGKMLGFTFPENFDYPYTAKSITDFWRRWHMTLGSWFREYVYIPLGGNRRGVPVLLRNLMVVWFLTGLWHGASWNFVLWGLYYGVILAVEKMWLLRGLRKCTPLVSHFYTLILVLLGWVLFVFPDFRQVLQYYLVLFGRGVPLIDRQALYLLSNYLPLLVIGMAAAMPWTKIKIQKLLQEKTLYYPVAILLYFFVLFLSTAYLVAASFNPFLYFRF